jgi:hypothetical protein
MFFEEFLLDLDKYSYRNSCLALDIECKLCKVILIIGTYFQSSFHQIMEIVKPTSIKNGSVALTLEKFFCLGGPSARFAIYDDRVYTSITSIRFVL